MSISLCFNVTKRKLYKVICPQLLVIGEYPTQLPHNLSIPSLGPQQISVYQHCSHWADNLIAISSNSSYVRSNYCRNHPCLLLLLRMVPEASVSVSELRHSSSRLSQHNCLVHVLILSLLHLKLLPCIQNEECLYVSVIMFSDTLLQPAWFLFQYFNIHLLQV